MTRPLDVGGGGDGEPRPRAPAEPRARPLWRRVAVAVVIAFALLGAVTGRVVMAGEGELAASTAALRAGDPVEATIRARRSAAWFAPGAPHVRVAYERLMALGKEAERRHQRQVALLAFEGVHEAAHSTRWLVLPHAGDVEVADQAIARLRAQDPRPPESAAIPDAKIERELLETLAARPGPSRAAAAGLGVSFVAIVAGLGWVLSRAVDATGRLVVARARLGLAVAAVGLGLWVVLLLIA